MPLGLTLLTIAVARIIKIIVSGRKAIVAEAQATSKFRKAIANLGKKLGSLLRPLLNVVAQVISLGAKGLAWLASMTIINRIDGNIFESPRKVIMFCRRIHNSP